MSLKSFGAWYGEKGRREGGGIAETLVAAPFCLCLQKYKNVTVVMVCSFLVLFFVIELLFVGISPSVVGPFLLQPGKAYCNCPHKILFTRKP